MNLATYALGGEDNLYNFKTIFVYGKTYMARMTNMCPRENKSVLNVCNVHGKICVQYMNKSVLMDKLGRPKEIFHTMQE